MDYIKKLGSLALASRLRRAVDEIQKQGRKVYSDLGIDFEVRWFSVFHFLAGNPKSTITQIAHSLKLQHPSVIQVVNEMSRHGLLNSSSDSRDRRRRQVSLTPEGRKLFRQLKPVWRAFDDAGREIARELDNDLIGAIEKFEAALERRSLYNRILSRLKLKAEEQ